VVFALNYWNLRTKHPGGSRSPGSSARARGAGFSGHATGGSLIGVRIVGFWGSPVGGTYLLCVANVSRWHGLDRLLRGIAAYGGMPNVILHIAGDGAELPHL